MLEIPVNKGKVIIIEHFSRNFVEVSNDCFSRTHNNDVKDTQKGMYLSILKTRSDVREFQHNILEMLYDIGNVRIWARIWYWLQSQISYVLQFY